MTRRTRRTRRRGGGGGGGGGGRGRRTRQEDEAGVRRRQEEATDIKSNNPHLAGGEKLNDELNWNNVNVLTPNVDIDTFEENNEGKIAIKLMFIFRTPKKINSQSYYVEKLKH